MPAEVNLACGKVPAGSVGKVGLSRIGEHSPFALTSKMVLRRMGKHIDENRFFVVGIMILILFAGTCLRAINLELDPDYVTCRDDGLFLDEGLYSLSARNLAKFGQANPNPKSLVVEGLESPIYTYSQFLSFKLFGVNLRALRIPSIVFSVISLLIFYFLVRHSWDKSVSLLSMGLLAFNYQFLQYNRLALAETLVTLFLLLSTYYFLIGGGRTSRLFFSGTFFGLAFITKGNAVFFLPAMLLSIWVGDIDKGWWRRNLPRLFGFGLGLAPILIIREIYVMGLWEKTISIDQASNPVPAINAIIEFAGRTFVFGSVGDWFKKFTQIIVSRFSTSIPIVFFTAFFYCAWFLGRLKRPLSPRGRGELLCCFWILSSVFFFSFFNYHPNRYRIPMVPQLCILAGSAFIQIYRSKHAKVDLFGEKYGPMIWGIALGLIFFRVGRIIVVVNQWALTNDLILAFSALFSVFVVVLLRRYRQIRIPYRQTWNKAFVTGCLAFMALLTAVQYGFWQMRNEFNIRSANEEIAKIAEGSIIGGQYAPILCLETEHIPVPIFKENLAQLNNLDLDYYLDVVQGNGNYDFKELKGLFPGFLDGEDSIKDFPVGGVVVSLFKFDLREF